MRTGDINHVPPASTFPCAVLLSDQCRTIWSFPPCPGGRKSGGGGNARARTPPGTIYAEKRPRNHRLRPTWSGQNR